NFVGPLIRESNKERVLGYIDVGVEEGADLLVDGRNIKEQTADGYYVGATIFDHVTPDMKIWQDEIFAPVLSIVRVKDLQEGIDLTNQSKFANGAVIYTSSGKSAQQFREKIDVGMVGINVNVPAPMAFFAVAGNKASFYGGLDTNTEREKSDKQVREKIDVGMVGIHVNVPAPMAFFAFAGNKASFYGDLGTNGKDGVQFYTRKKVVTERWF